MNQTLIVWFAFICFFITGYSFGLVFGSQKSIGSVIMLPIVCIVILIAFAYVNVRRNKEQ
jgi:hypothetical protein